MLSPECQRLDNIGFFEGCTHQATMAYFSKDFDNGLLESLYRFLEPVEGIEFGFTSVKKHGMLVRILGYSSDSLERCLAGLRNEIYNWRAQPGFIS